MILVDTQSILWFATGSDRLSATARSVLWSGAEALVVSAVVAFEYADLNRRGRFGLDVPLTPVLARFGRAIVDYPADANRIAETLPDIHRDPIDRMLIAHALHAGLAIVTADATIRRYPVATIW